MTWEEIKSIIDKLVTIKCELKDVEYKLEFAWDDWVDYVDEDTIKVLEDGLKNRHDTLIKQQEECYSNIKDFVVEDTIVDTCEQMDIEGRDAVDLFDACSIDVDEAMHIHQKFEKRIDQWLDNQNKTFIEKKQKAINALKEEYHKLKETVGDIKAPVPSYNVTPPAIFTTCFHGETHYKCPHCMNSFEYFEIIYNDDAKTEETGIYICPKCKKRFKL